MPASGNPVSPLTTADVELALADSGVQIPPPFVRETTVSTNDEALELASAGAAEWTIVVADQQSAGRGRLGRTWESTSGRALLFSVILRPDAEWRPAALGWIPLIAGLAVARSVQTIGIDASLKWPNDVVIDGLAHDGSAGPRKLCGILAERRADAVVVGVGVNVAQDQPELPIPTATSLALEGADVSRVQVLAACLGAWQSLWDAFRFQAGDAESSGMRRSYLDQSLSVGRRVRVDLGGGVPLVGDAVDIDAEGRLVVEGPFGRQSVSAGDVTHLRH